MPFEFKKLDIPDLVLIEPRVFNDDRGFFLETFKKSDFTKNGISEDFQQDNHSFSCKGVLRGLHYQNNPSAQGKLVRVVKGKVWDVAVDLRKSSPTFKKWIAVELTEDNHKMLYIPPGFAHAFLTLFDNTHFLYKCTNEYSKDCEGGIIWNDSELNIKWPIEKPLVSEKDMVLPLLKDANIFD